MDILSVSSLNYYIKSLIEHDFNLKTVHVRAEISNLINHRSGHIYLTLKDSQSQIKCVMFRSDASKLRFLPENNMSVIATGRIGVYERDGSYQLYISELQPDGIGALAIAFEQIKNRLSSLGYFAQERKKTIPKFPETIGVVTSPTGAALQDIINIVSRRYPLAKIKLYPALVQGKGAADSIVDGINYFNVSNDADILIVGRGGGSLEDLWAFNEECVAQAIVNSHIPIISAVGHETDYTISDFCADLRAPTPSAAAEICVPDIRVIYNNIFDLKNQLLLSCERVIAVKQSELKILSNQIGFYAPETKINNYQVLIDSLSDRLNRAITDKIHNISSSLSLQVQKFENLNPLNVLKRGYSIAYFNSTPIKSVESITSGDKIKVKLTDGYAICQVEDVVNEKKQL